MLLERERELKLIDDALARAADGRGCALVIEGEAGIGKTALLAHAGEEALRRGFQVFAVRAGMFERSVGFGMARELFESTLAGSSRSARRALLSGSAQLAAPIFGIDSPLAAGQAASGDQAVHHGLYWLVANLTDSGPVALLLDDAHWCDEPTLQWLLYLGRRVQGLPVAIVLASRTGEPDAPHALLAALATESVTSTVSVRPLSLEGTSKLVEEAYGKAADLEFARACHQWTRGNPMFVAELSSELVAEGIEPLDASVAKMRQLTPPSISRVTLLRLARLPESAVALSRALAVLGSVADSTTAGVLAGLSPDDATAAADVLVAARIIEPGHPPRFTHPLVASVVYDDHPAARRSEDHKRAARLLIDGGAEPERVATQLLRTPPAGEGWVVDALLAGAQRELARASAPTAIELLRRARDEPPPQASLSRVLSTLGLAESLAGDPAAAVSLEAALSASTDPNERGGIALLLGRVLLRAGRTADAVAALEPAIDELGSDQEDLRLQLEATVLTAARFDVRLVELATRRLERLGPLLLSDSHGGRLIAGQLSWGSTAGGASVAESVALARRALDDGRMIRESPFTPDAYLLPILMLSLCDELEAADASCTQALALARQSGSAPAYAGTACIQSGIAYLRGRLVDGELLARDALRLAAGSTDLALVRGIAPAYLANILLERGAVTEAVTVLGDTSGLEASPLVWATELLFGAGRVRLAEQRLPEAVELLLACGRRCVQWRVKNPAWLPWRSDAALALQQLGDHDRAAELSEEELGRARRFGARRPLGVALRARGLIEGGSPGLELLRESAAVLNASPARLERARTLVALGSALRRANRRADAREPLTAGLELADECGSVRLAREATAELRACGARPRSVIRRDSEALTASERRVCEMAAAGMSNPEIAQALFVTRATVESHLHAAYRKLDLTSRKQLATALALDPR